MKDKPNILVVDDKAANLAAMKTLLKLEKANVFTAISAKDALKLLIDHTFAMLLLDVQMPEMDGYELAEIIRQEEATKDIPIIFVTAQDQSKAVEMKGYSKGAVDVIFKPVERIILLSKVRVFLELYKQKYAMLALQEAEHKQLIAESHARAKSEFLANMSHEIRTPMSAVLGFAELLQETPLNGDQKNYLDTIDSSGQILLSIINDILDFSKFESGKLEFEEAPLELSRLVNDAIAIAKIKAKDKDIAIESHIVDSNEDWFLGDSTRISQILLNLLSNAVKFTDKGFIKVHVDYFNCIDEESQSYSIGFRVEDSGIGMKKDTQKKIFSAYTQADSSTARKFGGTGLGMTICKHFVEKMGGQIEVKSQENVGTNFIFNIILRTCEKPVEEDSETLDNSIIENLRVLVVEDNQANQKLISLLLKKLKCRFSIAENGQKALETLKSNEFDIIFMDLHMPVMGGIECSEKLKELSLTSAPVIALTADVVGADLEKCSKAGMTGYLLKPLDRRAFEKTLFKCALNTSLV
ncbi:MAG: response regulator [Lentisphaeraceae bacterium]|nr:response regulator [Lentisphaeraceae bacterium]